MPKKARPSYVVELPLDATPADQRRLQGVFEAGKRLNNVLLQEGHDIVAAVRRDPAWAAARKLPHTTAQDRQARSEAFQAVRRVHGFSDYDFQTRATRHKNAAGFDDRLSAHATQKLGTKVFKALEENLLGKRGRPRFKGIRRPVHSIEGKNTDASPRWSTADACFYLNKDWAIAARPARLATDEWLWSALQGELKYTRLVWRKVGTERRYYAQLVFDGHAPMKASLAQRLLEVPHVSTGGIDIGPSTIAWCTKTDAGVFRFCAEVDAPERLIRHLRRKADRQNRANNPDNFDAKGRAKRGRKWTKSALQRQTEAQLQAAQTKTTERRNHAHGRDINKLLEKARSWRHDGVSVRSLQKNYGRSISRRAPGHFMSELKRKAESAGGTSSEVNVRQLKTSQYDHSTGAFVKKTLSERWHRFGDGRGQCQRDVYSAFLALHAVDSVDADGVVTQVHDRAVLEAAWVKLEPILRRRGLFAPKGVDEEKSEGVNTDELAANAAGEGASIALQRGPRQPSSSKASNLGSVSGLRARGAVRVESSPQHRSEPEEATLARGTLGRPGVGRNHRPSER